MKKVKKEFKDFTDKMLEKDKMYEFVKHYSVNGKTQVNAQTIRVVFDILEAYHYWLFSAENKN